jgi:hypothetical protein
MLGSLCEITHHSSAVRTIDERDKVKIRKLANFAKEEIGHSEEDVKINFIVPLSKAFDQD